MSRPAKFRFFTCPSCAALYQVVKAEAGPETGTSELACLVCAGNPIEQAFAKIKHWMRSAQKRTIEDAWRHIGSLVETIDPTECNNYFANAGYASVKK